MPKKEVYRKDPDKYKRINREYYKNNIETKRLYSREWYKNNKDKVKIYKKKRKLLNPIRFRLDSFNRRGKQTNKKCDLTVQWCIDNYTGKCQITKIPFTFTDNVTPFSASVDRIDNDKGYTKDNCRIILNGLNFLKGVGSDIDMKLICYATTKNLTKQELSAIKDKYYKLIRK